MRPIIGIGYPVRPLALHSELCLSELGASLEDSPYMVC
jgi:hypothetical protein